MFLQLSLLLPSVAAFGMYALVHLETRFLRPFFVLLWMGVFGGLRLPDSAQRRRLATGVIAVIVLTLWARIGALTLHDLRDRGREWIRWNDPATHTPWRVAQGVMQMGLQPGDTVAAIGYAVEWARLAKVRVVAEIPMTEAAKFWSADQRLQARAIQILAHSGAKWIVAEKVVGPVPAGWQRVADTDHYVYVGSR